MSDLEFLYFWIFLLLVAAVKILSVPLFIVFLILRLCGVVAWAWWLVCLPLMLFAAEAAFELVVHITDKINGG